MKSARSQVPPATVEEGSAESEKACGQNEQEATSLEQQMLLRVSLLIVGMEVDRLMKHLGVKIKQAWVEG